MSQYDTSIADTTSGTYGRTVTAFFDERNDAQDAVRKLRDLGIASNNINLTEGRANSGTPIRENHQGFFESLANFFMPEEDRYTYAEGLNRGGYLVTVTSVSAALYQQLLDILDDEGSIDIDERADSWRADGWAGYTSPSGVSVGGTGTYTTDAGLGRSSQSAMNREAAEDRVLSASDNEAIPVVQEELRIGKRDVSHGRVRVRSYTVEEPVRQEVDLHNERVVLDRRPVNRALDSADAAFRDRTIEAEERSEEAVVAKEARVVEEVSLRNEGEDRTETVSDTVRHTEVEVDDERDVQSVADRSRRGS